MGKPSDQAITEFLFDIPNFSIGYHSNKFWLTIVERIFLETEFFLCNISCFIIFRNLSDKNNYEFILAAFWRYALNYGLFFYFLLTLKQKHYLLRQLSSVYNGHSIRAHLSSAA
ncbi:unnamed protein product [Blepharisma stoltei]|uniref:Maturase K n=1 Tax=Blepharisma stoltei TaxID=1481888 RepID=A0AAU9INK8_9CILI|nr:unnamed protein product [Blepharisma stoltei]